jgi:hypothetical protein
MPDPKKSKPIIFAWYLSEILERGQYRPQIANYNKVI